MTDQANTSPNTNKQNPIARSWDWLTVPSSSIQEVGNQQLASLFSSFTLAILLLLISGTIASSASSGLKEAFKAFSFSLFATLASYLLSRTKYYQLGVFIFSLGFSTNAYLSIGTEGSTANPGLIVLLYVPLSLIVASAFLSSWAVFLLTGLNIAAFYMVIKLTGIPEPKGFGAMAGVITAIGVVLIFLNNFRANVEKIRFKEVTLANRKLEALSNELEQRVQERTRDLEQRSQEIELRTDELIAANLNVERNARKFATVSHIARQISSIRDLKKLLPNVTALISRQFGYYHVGIFLLDEGQQMALLSATNSEGGKKMLARGHRLKVGEEGIVGFVTGTGNPRIALDTGTDAVYFDNPDLPETRSEMAVPLNVGDQIIGALDIQDKNQNAFKEDDIEVISTLADLVGIAIENARLFEDSQQSLAEAQAIARQYSQQEWESLRKKQSLTGLRYSVTGTDILQTPLRAPTIDKALAQGDVYIEEKAQTSTPSLAVPIKLRDQIIGVLNISNPNKDKWTNDEIDIAKAVAERLAISAENARLFEETTRRAERERMVSDITSKIRSTNDPQAMLQTALDELQKALGGAQVQIRPYEKPVIKRKKTRS